MIDGITLYLSEKTNKLPVGKLPRGASKFFGNPDVWDGFVWPHYTENGEEYDLTFMCQINCGEAAPFDTSGLLPKAGMLYFFYDMDIMPQESSDQNAARILYFGGGTEDLRAMLRCDHEGNDMGFREAAIYFGTAVGEHGKLCGQLCVPTDEEWQPVLKILSFETDDFSVRFTNHGELCFFMERDKLKELDFENVRVRQLRGKHENKFSCEKFAPFASE